MFMKISSLLDLPGIVLFFSRQFVSIYSQLQMNMFPISVTIKIFMLCSTYQGLCHGVFAEHKLKQVK